MNQGNDKRPKFFRREEFWSLLLTGFFYIYNLVFFAVKGRDFVNSDAACEMMLSSLLNKEGGFLSRNWYYSSELRVLNTQFIYKIGLLFFPHNWHVARTLSIALFMLILIAAGVFFMWAIGRKNKGFWLAAVLICPFGKWYAWNVIYCSYYVPHIVISLFSIGLFFRCLRSPADALKEYPGTSPAKKSKNSILLIVESVLLILLCFVAGLGGARQPMVCYAPFFLACLIVFLTNRGKGEKWKMLIYSTAMLLSGALGFVVNSKVLSKIYTFKDYNETAWNEFTLAPVWSVLEQFIRQFGWQKNVEFFSLAGMVNLASMMLLAGMIAAIAAVAVKSGQKSLSEFVKLKDFTGAEELFSSKNSDEFDSSEALRLITIYVLCAFLMLLLIFSETWVYNESYWLPLVPFFFIPLILVIELPGKKLRGVILMAVLSFYLVVSGISVSRNPYLEEIPIDLRLHTVADWLKDNGYHKGVASFWRAGMITELTDGEVEFWTVQNVVSMEPVAWLQEKDHVESFPNEEFFVLMDVSELNDPAYQKEQVLQKQVYNDGSFAILVFKNYGEYQKLMAQKSVIL